jgi:copper transport protein
MAALVRARVTRLAVLMLACAAVLIGAAASPAEAHAYLVSSNPADGTRLEAAPPRLELSFSEHVVAQATHITVVDTSGRVARVTGLHLVTRDANDTEEPSTIVVSFKGRLRAAAYRVSWETLSSDDLHRTAGVFAFGVGRTVQATAAVEPRPAVDEATLRAGFLIGLALLLGGLLAERISRRSGASVALPRRLARWGGGVALVISMLLLVSQLVRAHTGFESVLLSSYGVRWGCRFLGLLVLVLAAARQPSRLRRTLCVVGATVTCLATASLGHAASGAFSPSRLLADGAHVAATLTWGGAVLCLGLGLLIVRNPGRTSGLRAALRAFAVPAAACLSVAVVTGLYLTSWVVGSVDAALLTFYGTTLLIKVAVVGAAAGLGLVNHLRLRHGSDVRLPRLLVPAEACAVVGAVLLASVLTSSQPATEPAYVLPRLHADTVPVGGRLADLQVSAGLSPNRPGSAVAVVDVFDTRRPAPAPITGVAVSLGATRPVEAEPVGDGHWSAPLSASRAGVTSLRVVVQRAGESDVSGRFTWTIGTGQVRHAATVSQAPVQGWLVGGAIAVGALLLGAWGAAGLLRVRRARGVVAEHEETQPPVAVTV